MNSSTPYCIVIFPPSVSRLSVRFLRNRMSWTCSWKMAEIFRWSMCQGHVVTWRCLQYTAV